MSQMTIRKCPRCDAEAILNEVGAVSRLTRDDGPDVLICRRCGQREALYGRDPSNHVQLSQWPVDIETLVREERALIEQRRGSDVMIVDGDDIVP